MTCKSLPLFAWLAVAVGAINLTVSESGGNASSPLQYGLMFEDINHSGDGGIYAETIMNRAFQGSSVYPSQIDPWTALGGAALKLQNTSIPLSKALPVSINVAASANTTSGTKIGIENPGYWGFDVQVFTYRGTFSVLGSYNGNVTATLKSYLTDDVWASVDIEVSSKAREWTEFQYEMTPSLAAPNVNNTFTLEFMPENVNSSLNFNLISLFPPTYNDRPNGMRIDLMEALKDLTPSFFRVPGGNNIEGDTPPYFWKWNETIGPLTERPGRPGTWGYENTDGLGLAEYLNWCEDLKVEPVLALWAGYYLGGPAFSNSSMADIVQMGMDELEYVLGNASTKYGALRMSHGYAEPWKVNHVEIGNEDNLGVGLPSYTSYRFLDFYTAIKSKYPQINVIASTVDSPTKPGDSAGDYHQYTRPNDFVSQFDYFDNSLNTTSTTHKTLVGEYALVQPNSATEVGTDWNASRVPFPYWIGTVAEAIFLLGIERNSDKIIGASYAPLFQNLDSYEWAPDLISFSADPKNTVLSTSYYQIQLFSGTRHTEVLPVTSDTAFGPAYWVAGVNNGTGCHILKAAVYNSTGTVPMSVSFEGVEGGALANLTVLTAADPYAMNMPGKDNVVVTNISMVTADKDGMFAFELPDLSIALLATE